MFKYLSLNSQNIVYQTVPTPSLPCLPISFELIMKSLHIRTTSRLPVSPHASPYETKRALHSSRGLLHGITTQMNWTWIFSAVKASKLPYWS